MTKKELNEYWRWAVDIDNAYNAEFWEKFDELKSLYVECGGKQNMPSVPTMLMYIIDSNVSGTVKDQALTLNNALMSAIAVKDAEQALRKNLQIQNTVAIT